MKKIESNNFQHSWCEYKACCKFMSIHFTAIGKFFIDFSINYTDYSNMKSNILTISERIKELRKNLGLNQSELAEKMGIDSKMISYYENGKYVPSAEILVKLAEVFDISIDYLLIKDIPKRPLRQNINNDLMSELSDFDNLPDKDKEMIIHMIHTVMSKNKMRELAIKTS